MEQEAHTSFNGETGAHVLLWSKRRTLMNSGFRRLVLRLKLNLNAFSVVNTHDYAFSLIFLLPVSWPPPPPPPRSRPNSQ